MIFIYTVGYIFLHGCIRSNAIFKVVQATWDHEASLSCTSSARVTEQTRGDVALLLILLFSGRNVGHVFRKRTSSPIKVVKC